MGKIISDIVFAWGSISRNRMLSVFTVVVSFFTCVFLSTVLQIADTVYGDNPPFSNSDRIISLVTDEFKDVSGRSLDGIYAQYIPGFSKSIRSSEMLGISETESILVTDGTNIFPTNVGFVSGHYWKMNDFEFVEGRGFTIDEAGNADKKAVITDEMSRKLYGKGAAVGQQLEVQGISYKIIGVVKNYSNFSTCKSHIDVWLTSANTKFMPSGVPFFNLDILFPENVSKDEFKQDLLYSLKSFYEKQNASLDLETEDLKTLKEQRIAGFGDEGGLFIGLGVIIVLLLLIPAINIITLNESGIQSRMQEFAVRRAVGATRMDIVKLIITENMILVCIGFVIGVIFKGPVVKLAENLFFEVSGEGFTILSEPMSVMNGICILVFAIVFAVISGGVPAWLATRKSISLIMKGGRND